MANYTQEDQEAMVYINTMEYYAALKMNETMQTKARGLSMGVTWV